MTIPHEEIRAQIDRMAASPVFSTAETQRRLLLFLAEKSLSGDPGWLKEYTIGVEALGKPETYDPQKDSIVRIQASRLRQKIASYYQNEGKQDPVVVDLPRGQFKLTFALQAHENTARSSDAVTAARWRYAAVALAVALLATGAWAVYATRALSSGAETAEPPGERWSPELAELWAPFLDGGRPQNRRPLLVVTGAALFIRVQDIGFVRLPEINNWNEREKSETLRKLSADFTKRLTPWTNFMLIGEGHAAFHLGRLFGIRRRDVTLTNSATLSWDEVAAHDMVFIGPPKFVPHVQEMQEQAYSLERNGVRVFKPQPGEPAFYMEKQNPENPYDGECYALLSRLSGIGQGSEVLAFGGNWGPGTLASAQYLTEPSLAAQLVKRLRLPSGALPRHYQAVIRVQFKNLTPLRTSIVSHRVSTP